MNTKLKRWLHAIIVMIITLFLCWQNSSDSTKITTETCQVVQKLLSSLGIKIEFNIILYYLVRKAGHCLVFAVLSLRLYLAFDTSLRLPKDVIVATILVGISTAILTEYAQLYFDGRTANFIDATINIVGITLGILAAKKTEQFKVYRLRSKLSTKQTPKAA